MSNKSKGGAPTVKKTQHTPPIQKPQHPQQPGQNPQQPTQGPILQVTHQAHHSGPIPSAGELAKYKGIQADLPDRIMKMAEGDLKHIQSVQKIEAITDSIGAILGIVSALVLGTFTVYMGAQVAMGGGPIEGTLLAGAGLGGILGVFIYGTKRNNNSPKPPVDDKKKK